ncbi:MAG TPA: alpha-2-macroglobulin family protein, partial [Candidatus Gracilibacteria bacterium]
TSLDGSFDDVFEIPADSPLGEYQVQVFIGDQQYFNTSFHIQKFRKPKFLIQSEFDSNYAIEKETVTAKAKAEYAFGGALKGRKIVYTASLFGQEPCTFWDFWCPQRDKVIVSGEGILGRDGSFELPIKLELEKDETEINWSLLNFTVTVEASADEKSSQTISIPFSPSSKRITLDYGKYFYYPGDEAKVSGSVTDLEGKALENQKVSLGLYKTKWVRNDRKGHDGDFYGEWEKEDEKISEQDIKTNAKGIFEINLVLPQEGGDYFFQVTTLDDKNRVAQTQRNFWIAGKEPTAIRQNEDNKILQLFSDQEDYNIGEKVEIFFPLSDFEVTYARATLERGDILEELEVDLEKNIITLQTEDWMAPNVFVSLFVQGQNKEDQIDIRWGALEIPVKDPSRKLEVKLDFDKTLYRPGEEVTIEIQTNVEDKVEDKGVPAEVTIAVVDQTLLALKSRPPLNLWQYFLANVPLAVTTTHTLDQFMTKDKMDAILAEADMVESKMMNGFGGGGGDSKVDGDKPRGDFRDTATFLATIKTDQNGKSTQTFTLPDNLTTWNVWAIGHTTENAFGKYESQIKSTLPLLISEIVPNFFHLGDQMQIGLLIRRNNPEVPSAKVTVDLTLPDFFESDLKTQTITVEEEARVFFDIRIPNTPELLSKDDLMVDIGFNIKSESGLKDAITLKRNLTMPVSKLTAAESVQVRTDDSNASQISLIPNVGESLLSKMVIDIYASLANKLDPIIEHIEDLNYGCTEQRFSYVTSLLLQDTLNRNLGNEPLPLDTLNLKEHLDYIQESFQADGFGFWKSSLRPNVWITTHILEYAPLWEKYGLKFDEEKIQNATNYLMTEATRECDENETWWCVDDGTRQHAFYVLTRYDQKVDLDFAAQYTDSLEAKIWWIKTYNSLKRQDIGISPLAGDTYQSFWKELESDLKFRDRYAFWEGGHSFYSQDERTTALIYSEIADHPTLKSFQSKIARYLAETPVTKLSTNSSLYVLQVMGALASQEAENKGAEFVVNLSSADQTAQTITKGTLENLQSEHQYEKVFTKDERGIQKLDLLPANEKSYYADVQLQEIFPSSKAKSISKGFWVEKQIFVLDDDKYASPLTELKLGETYRIRLRVITNTNHRQVRIVDFIPSGSDILNFAFDNVDANLQPKPDQPWYCRGWCQPLYEHHEFHEDRAEFFMDFLGNGTHQIEYLIQTRLPGSFELKPAQAQEMYFPEVFGTSDGMKVEIK